MTNVPTILDQAGLPVGLDQFVDMNIAAETGVAPSYGIISIAGGRFTIRLPDREPISWPHLVLPVVVVGVPAHLSRAWYARPYQAGQTDEPDCWSIDSTAPAPNARNKQSVTCASCPHSQWGTARNADGSARRGQACSQHRRLAVMLLRDLDGRLTNGPLLLRIPPASLLRFAQYAARLKPTPMIAVVTNLSFATGTTGELQFEAERPLNHDELTKAVRWYKSYQALTIMNGTGAGATTAPVVEPAPASAPPVAEPAPAPEPVVEQPSKAAPAKGRPGKKAAESTQQMDTVELLVPRLDDEAAEASLADELTALLDGKL